MALILMLFSEAALASPGLCGNKLLAHSEQAHGTTEFNMYLEMLLDNRELTAKDLEPFLKALKSGKLINPIPHQNNKIFEFHHFEFAAIIHQSNLDIKAIDSFLYAYLHKDEIVRNQKKKTSKSIDGLFFVTSEGATFYRMKHPKLGMVYRILKPGKKASDPNGFDEILWAVTPLKTKHKHLPPQGLGLNQKYSDAELACIRQGGRLPTDQDYRRLGSYFEKYDVSDLMISKYGLKELAQIFKPVGNNKFWASPSKAQDLSYSPRSGWMFTGSSGMLLFIEGQHELYVRCVATESR